MAADAGVEPIGNVDCAIGTDGDIGRTEEGLQFAGDRLGAALEINAFEPLLLVGGKKIETFERIARALGLGKITEERVACGFAAQQHPAPFFAEGIAFIHDDSGGCAAAIHIA